MSPCPPLVPAAVLLLGSAPRWRHCAGRMIRECLASQCELPRNLTSGRLTPRITPISKPLDFLRRRILAMDLGDSYFVQYLVNLASQLPELLVCVIGVFLGMIWWWRHRKGFTSSDDCPGDSRAESHCFDGSANMVGRVVLRKDRYADRLPRISLPVHNDWLYQELDNGRYIGIAGIRGLFRTN